MQKRICVSCGESFFVPNKKHDLFLFCSKECVEKEKEKETSGIVLGKRKKELWSKWKCLLGMELFENK